MNPARLVLPALRWREGGDFAHEDENIGKALDLGVGGFIIFGGTVASVTALTAELEKRAGRPLLLASDLERGAGQQIRGLAEIPPPRALATLGDPRIAYDAGLLTGTQAREVGLNWVLAPDADLDCEPANPIVQTRAFGDDPEVVARLVDSWVRGCQASGALACIKHYPGHGRTTVDSHAELPTVDAPASALSSEDRAPFNAGIRAGVASVMTAHVAFPALDPSGRAATLSPVILGELRRTSGFEGLIVTDALIMAGATGGAGAVPAVVQAVRAGCDLLLYPGDIGGTVSALNSALADGSLNDHQVWASLHRLDHALQRIAAAGRPLPVNPELPAVWADRLLAGGMARGELPAFGLDRPVELVVVDDDLGGPWPPGPSDWVSRALAGRAVRLGAGGDRVVLAFAEPRGWKGRAGFSDDSRKALVAASEGAGLIVLFGHERLVAELPPEVPVLVAWHRQRLMQEAVARLIEGRRL